MFVSQKKVAGVNPITDRKVVICPKVQPGTSRTLSEIYATVRLYEDGGTFLARGGGWGVGGGERGRR